MEDAQKSVCSSHNWGDAASMGSCSSKMLAVGSGEYVSTIAEKLWRRHTPATTGFLDERFVKIETCVSKGGKERAKNGRRTREDVPVYAGELYVGLCRVGNHEDVDDFGANGFGEGVSEDVLDLDRRGSSGDNAS